MYKNIIQILLILIVSFTASASDGHQGEFICDPLIIAPKNSDIRLVAVGGAAISVSGGIVGYLAVVQ